MNTRARRGSIFTWLLALALLAAVAYGWRAGDLSASAAAAPAAQDIARVESRLNLIEQRFRSIELSISRLEQQSRLQGLSTSAATHSEDARLLRAEIDALRRRLAEVECGLVRIDERTLAPAARDERRKGGGSSTTDPCRLNAPAPLSLPSRP